MLSKKQCMCSDPNPAKILYTIFAIAYIITLPCLVEFGPHQSVGDILKIILIR